jgi:hypothetical protein
MGHHPEGTMTVGVRGERASTRRLAWLAAALIGAIAIAACGDGRAGAPRPTDPRQILVNAIAATAALPAVRLHAELTANLGPVGAAGNAAMNAAFDADIDLATRQFAGRSTVQVPQGMLGGGGGADAQQVSDIIVTSTATFNRDSRTGRWTKFQTGPGGGISASPTNAQIAATIANLISNPSITLELLDATPCTLGTCDHVLAHIDGATLGAALGPLLGEPMDAASGVAIPNFDVDVRVDQATSVISEVRAEISMQGTTARILVSLTNPGQPVQIAPPPPALTDDLGVNFGGGGIGPDATILEEVGNELPTDEPEFPEESPPAP